MGEKSPISKMAQFKGAYFPLYRTHCVKYRTVLYPQNSSNVLSIVKESSYFGHYILPYKKKKKVKFSEEKVDDIRRNYYLASEPLINYLFKR